jgi:hypothetical protein
MAVAAPMPIARETIETDEGPGDFDHCRMANRTSAQRESRACAILSTRKLYSRKVRQPLRHLNPFTEPSWVWSKLAYLKVLGIIGDPGAGQITSNVLPPRQIQLGLHLSF